MTSGSLKLYLAANLADWDLDVSWFMNNAVRLHSCDPLPCTKTMSTLNECWMLTMNVDIECDIRFWLWTVYHCSVPDSKQRVDGRWSQFLHIVDAYDGAVRSCVELKDTIGVIEAKWYLDRIKNWLLKLADVIRCFDSLRYRLSLRFLSAHSFQVSGAFVEDAVRSRYLQSERGWLVDQK